MHVKTDGNLEQTHPANMDCFNIDEDILELMFELNGRELESLVDMVEDCISGDDIELYIFVALFFSQKVGCPRAAQCATHACESWLLSWVSNSKEKVRRQRIMSHVREQQFKLRQRIHRPWSDIPRVDHMVEAYKRTLNTRYLDAAISMNELQMSSVPPEYKCWVRFLNTLRTYLFAKVDALNSQSDLDRTIEYIDTLMVATRGHVLESQASEGFGDELRGCFHSSGNLAYLERAIRWSRNAVATCLNTDAQFKKRALLLGDCLLMRWGLQKSPKDLDDGIHLMTQGLEGISVDEDSHLAYSLKLVNSLYASSENTSNMGHLDRAVDISVQTLANLQHDHAGHAKWLAVSGMCLAKRFHMNGNDADYSLALEQLDWAICLQPDEPGHRYWLYKLLDSRYHRTNNITVLELALESIKVAYASGRSTYGLNVANCLRVRSKHTGSQEDLEEAINIASQLVEDEAVDNNGHASMYLRELSVLLYDRYMMVGSLADLDRGVVVAKKATILDDQDVLALFYLSRLLGERFDRTRDLNDIDQAIRVANTVLGLDKKPDLFSFNHIVSELLLKRFSQTGSQADLDRARELSAVEHEYQKFTRFDHLGLAYYWSSRARALKMEGTKESMESSIECQRKVLEFVPSDNALRAITLLIIVESTSFDFSTPNKQEDCDQARSDLINCWNCRAAPLHIRMRIVNQAAETAAIEEACQLLSEATDEFPRLFPRSLSNSDRQSLLETVSNIASNAAYYHLQRDDSPATSLGFLEVGRTVLSNILMEMRTDTSDLRDAYPQLAEQFTSLVETLDSSIQSIPAGFEGLGELQPVKWESNAAKRRRADTEFTKLLEHIRTKPGFERFLLPLSEEDIMAAANPDPIVVINLHNLKSHAFLIESSRIRALELPNLTRTEVQKKADELNSMLRSGSQDMRPFLRWLWNVVCHPCLKELGLDRPVADGKWPRVWWIPTGGLSQFPLHAAGVYEGDSPNTVLDCVISSYAVSINSLRHNRRLRSRKSSVVSGSRQALLISMRHTLGQDSLRFTEEEINALSDLCPDLSLDRVKPDCTREEVLHHLSKCHIFHFAGHGSSHPSDPSKSLLLLRDWQTNPLTVGDLRETKLQSHRPFLGYLSACSTGSNKRTQLLDEGVHLVGAFQLAGFQHVVGTLWAVSDKSSADVARAFYEVLKREGMTDRAVCEGLHEALRELRRQQSGEITGSRAFKWPAKTSATKTWGEQTWIPYIHFGV